MVAEIFVNGGAGINALAGQVGAKVVVVDMGVASDISAMAASGKIIDKKVAFGTANMAAGPAMSRLDARPGSERLPPRSSSAPPPRG